MPPRIQLFSGYTKGKTTDIEKQHIRSFELVYKLVNALLKLKDLDMILEENCTLYIDIGAESSDFYTSDLLTMQNLGIPINQNCLSFDNFVNVLNIIDFDQIKDIYSKGHIIDTVNEPVREHNIEKLVTSGKYSIQLTKSYIASINRLVETDDDVDNKLKIGVLQNFFLSNANINNLIKAIQQKCYLQNFIIPVLNTKPRTTIELEIVKN